MPLMSSANFYSGTCMWVKRNGDIMFLPASHVKKGDVLLVIVDGHYVRGSVVTSVKPDLSPITVRAIHIIHNDPESDFIFVQRKGLVQYPTNPQWLYDDELGKNKGGKVKSKKTLLITVEKCDSSTPALGCLDGNIHFC
jgi:hypothetical protein